MKPKFQELWNKFPDHTKFKNLEALYTSLGGKAVLNIHADGFGPNGNTCASRMSVAFNEARAPLDKIIINRINAKTIGTKSPRFRIIFRVKDFKKYLEELLGNPSIDNVRPFDSKFKNKKGIIVFAIKGWRDATGHIALWNGNQYREPSYDNYSNFGSTSSGAFWELK